MVYPQPLSENASSENASSENEPFADAPPPDEQMPPIDWQAPLREFSSLVLGLATVPVLAGLCVARACAERLPELGDMGEEIFRGTRLPVLRFPNTEESGDREERETRSKQ